MHGFKETFAFSDLAAGCIAETTWNIWLLFMVSMDRRMMVGFRWCSMVGEEVGSASGDASETQ